jgi:hypothetical protein
MKKTLLSLLIIILFSCDDEPGSGPIGSWGYFEARVNGEEWNADFYPRGFQAIYAHQGFETESIPCNEYYIVQSIIQKPVHGSYHPEQVWVEALSFLLNTTSPGHYDAQDFFHYECDPTVPIYVSLTGRDGDVSRSGYFLLDSEDNFVEIESYDAESGEIKGTFQLTFANAGPSSASPETLRFTQGKFHTKIIMNN